MVVTVLDPSRKEEWDSLAGREPFFALLQTWRWGEFKEAIGWKAFRIAVEEEGELVAGAQMLVRRLPIGTASIAYIARGPIGRWLEEPIFDVLMEKIRQVAQSCQAIFLRIEPAVENSPEVERFLTAKKFHATELTTQPRATLILDLRPSLEEVFQQFRKSARRKIGQAERKGITVQPGRREHLDDFYTMMTLTAQRGGFAPKSLDYYQREWEAFERENQVRFLLARYEEQIVAADLVYVFGKHAAFFHQASSGEAAQLNPNSLLVWEEIKWAKAQGCETFDLWGIPDEVSEYCAGDEIDEMSPTRTGRTDGLWGVYQFKRGFCKKVVSFVGTYDLALNPFRYQLISNRLINERTPERIQVWMQRHNLRKPNLP
jgi:peptidoglycan pentaglycine glycine transferase (the first glycine)